MITNAAPITNDNVAGPVPATPPIDPQGQAGAPESNSGSPVVAQAPIAERPSASVMDSGHIPALLGTALVLAFIILGSIASQQAGRFLQRRRHQRALHDAAAGRWDAPHADDAVLDIATAAPRVRRRERATEPRDARPVVDPAPVPATALALEDNVRELLHRLQVDLKTRSARPAGAAVSAPHPVTPAAPSPANVPGDLEAALAVWAGKKKRR